MSPVAFVTPGWPPGKIANGITTYTGPIRAAFQQLGARVFILTDKCHLEQGDSDVIQLGIRALRQKLFERIAGRAWGWVDPGAWHARTIVRALCGRIERLRREANLQIVQMEETRGWAGRVAHKSPIPVVVRMHGPWFLVGPAQGMLRNRRFRQRVELEGLALGAAAGVTAGSRFTLDSAREYYGLELPNAEVIPNAVAPVAAANRWRFSECQRRHVLFVGRFDRCKGGDVVVDALARVLRQEPDVRLSFVGRDGGFGLGRGNGDLWDCVSYAKDALGPLAGSRFRYLGPLPGDEIRELRPKAAVTVVASRFENFPNVALEAMVHGCPLIATNVGGIPEMIQHGRNGLLCKAGDADDLAHKIILLLRNPDLAARLGEQARVDVESRYHPDIIARCTLAFYERVIETADRHRRGRKDNRARR